MALLGDFLDQLIPLTCNFEKFNEGSRDQLGHLKKNLTSWLSSFIIFFFFEFLTEVTILLYMGRRGILKLQLTNFKENLVNIGGL